MKIPQHLKHHPVLTLEDYDLIDGPYAEDGTDAKGLSLGLAQWNERGNVEISAKVWRYPGERWSRQSEELPFHRVLDLALLICHAQKLITTPKATDLQKPNIGEFDFQGESLPVNLNIESSEIAEDLKLFKERLEKDQKWIIPRLARLAETLKNLKV